MRTFLLVLTREDLLQQVRHEGASLADRIALLGRGHILMAGRDDRGFPQTDPAFAQ